MNIKRRRCIFCSKDKPFKGKEHAVPQWILRELHRENVPQPFFKTDFSRIENFLVESKSEMIGRFGFRNFKSPSVCDLCNGGWLSKLENDIKPIFLPLINGESCLESLPLTSKRLIARWAVKTSIVINSVSFGDKSFSELNGRAIYNRQTLPPGWAVFGFTHSPSSSLGYFTNNVWFVEGLLPAELKERLGHCRKTILQLNHLVLATVFICDKSLQLQAVDRLHFSLDRNLDCRWIPKPASPSFTTYKNVEANSSDDRMLRFLGALSLLVLEK